MDFCVANLGDGLEELSLLVESILGFGFYLGFPINVCTTNAWFFDPVRVSNCVSLDFSLVK